MTEQTPEDPTRSFEYLADAPSPASSGPPRRRPGRRVVAGITIGALVAAGAAGAFAVAEFLDGGPSAAAAAPADTMAFLSVDLDPSGGQKLAAYQTLKKFPALEKQLGLRSQDDLRRWAFDGLTSGTDCSSVDFGDVEPWLGNALGVGAVPGKDEPTVFFSLEVTDQDKAAAGVRRLADCLGEDKIGTAFVGDFMLVAQTKAKADDLAASAEGSSLADDPTYEARTGEAGDDGVVTGYLAPSFGDFMSDQLGSLGGMLGGSTTSEDTSSSTSSATLAGRAGALTEDTPEPGAAPSGSGAQVPEGLPSDFPSEMLTELPSDFPTDFPTDFPSEFPEGEGLPGGMDGMDGMGMPPFGMGLGLPGLLLGGLSGLGGSDQLVDRLADFGGAAMKVRFADESLEMEVSTHGLDQEMAQDGSVSLGDLPSDTGLAFGLATGERWAQKLVDGLRKQDPKGFDQEMADASKATGLSLPDDLPSLVGDSVSVAFDSGVDFPELFGSFFLPGGSSEPVKAGLRIAGDPDEIAPLVQKLVDYASKDDGQQLVVATGEDAVAVGFDQGYADQLAKGGDLSGSDAFDRALPEDGDNLGAAFADFDANGWLDRALKGSSAEDRANAEPLSALGVTMTRDGDALHTVLRLSTD